jgi:hypothetical protein
MIDVAAIQNAKARSVTSTTPTRRRGSERKRRIARARRRAPPSGARRKNNRMYMGEGSQGRGLTRGFTVIAFARTPKVLGEIPPAPSLEVLRQPSRQTRDGIL